LEKLDDGTRDDDASASTARCVVKFVRADLSDANEASSVVVVPGAVQVLSKELSLPKPIAISGVVNAAAITSRGNLLSTSAEMFDEQFATNVRGPFL